MAFVRCWAEGLDLGTAWLRYRPDAAAGAARQAVPVQRAASPVARRARRLLEQLLDELRALARAHGRPDLAVLLRRDPEAISDARGLETDLDDFRASQPPDFYTEAELLALYQLKHGRAPAGGSARRRQRLRERLVAAVQWLGERARPAPLPTDPLTQWLDERVCARLARAGLSRFADLAERMQRQGRHWHRGVPWFGAAGARRLEAWWRNHTRSLGPLPLDAPEVHASGTGLPSETSAPAPLAFGMVPFERFAPPPGLDGRTGSNRLVGGAALDARRTHSAGAPGLASRGGCVAASEGACDRCRGQPPSSPSGPACRAQPCAAPSAAPLNRPRRAPATASAQALDGQSAAPADDDRSALQQWLQAQSTSAHTRRSYRQQVERLWLWCTLVRHKPLSSLKASDVPAYLAFLAQPDPGWCGPRHARRGSRLWRPLEGPLSGPSIATAVAVLRSLFSALVRTGYLASNPWPAGLQAAAWPHPLSGLPAEPSPSASAARRLQAMVACAPPVAVAPPGFGLAGVGFRPHSSSGSLSDPDHAEAEAEAEAKAGAGAGAGAEAGAGAGAGQQPAQRLQSVLAPPSGTGHRRRAAVLQLALGAGLRLSEAAAARRSWLRPVGELAEAGSARWVLVVPGRAPAGDAATVPPDERPQDRPHQPHGPRQPAAPMTAGGRRIPLSPSVARLLQAHGSDMDALWGPAPAGQDRPLIGRLPQRGVLAGQAGASAGSPAPADAAQPLSAARIAAIVRQAGPGPLGAGLADGHGAVAQRQMRAAAGRPGDAPPDQAEAASHSTPQRWSVRRLRRAHVEIALADGMPRPVLRHRLGWRSRSALSRYAPA